MRFKGSLEVEFPQNQVTLIAGDNGSGKTSILDALCVCLYGRTLRTSGRATSGFLSINDLVNHESDKAIIRVEFENHGHNYVVTREITHSDTGGELLEDGESKAVGRHVYAYVRNRAIGLDWEGFRKSTVVLQGEMSALTDLDPGPRKKAFTELFGLDKYSAYEKLAKEKIQRKESDIHATEEADKILQADIKKIPDIKEEIEQVSSQVKTLKEKKVKLEKIVETKKTNIKTLEDNHNEYIRQKEKADTARGQIDAAKKDIEDNRNDLNRLLSIQKRFNSIKSSYVTYTTLDEKISKIQPTKSEYDKISTEILKHDTTLADKRDSLSDIVDQIKDTKSAILKLRKQIPSPSKLTKTEKSLNAATAIEKGLKDRSNSIRGQIKQIEESIESLKARRDQVKGKDECPVCLQKITDQQHVTKHYDDEISALVSKKTKLGKEQVSILRRLKTVSETVKRLDSLQRQLEKDASKIDQVTREQNRLSSLIKRKDSIKEQIDKTKADSKSLSQKRDSLGFNPIEYGRLDAKIKQLRKDKVAENYANAKTELDRLPKVRQELETSLGKLSDLVNENRSLETRLKQLSKLEKKYTDAKQSLDESQHELNDNGKALATESERERQSRDKLEDLEDKERKFAKNLEQIERLKEEIITLEELRDIFKNIPENILRRLRPFIEKEGTDIINELSNNNITALNIDEDTLNIAATMNGEVRPIHYYSGGQKTRINMALRVAISRILSKMPQTDEHTFAIMQTLFIDEGDFGNLDEDGVREAVNVIRNLTKEFDCVILISHVDTIREIFHGHTVEIQKNGLNESTISVLAR
ncbi:MAG: SMC family ATPase [Candidatus Nitrosotenuis sp.]|nr:MAG: SMC family ATPase [Candidatus Nitrosotenuis sp.]